MYFIVVRAIDAQHVHAGRHQIPHQRVPMRRFRRHRPHDSCGVVSHRPEEFFGVPRRYLHPRFIVHRRLALLNCV